VVTENNANIQCFEQLSFIDFAGNYQLRFPVGLGTGVGPGTSG
jgi:hypothetical protein